jgi:hypothetical protein
VTGPWDDENRRQSVEYRLGRAEGLLVLVVEHYDHGDDEGVDLEHTVDLIRRYLAGEP